MKTFYLTWIISLPPSHLNIKFAVLTNSNVNINYECEWVLIRLDIPLYYDLA